MGAGDGTRTRALNPPLHAVAAEIEPVTAGAAVEAVDRVDSVWTGPGEPTIVTGGRVRTVTASGDERFTRIRRLGGELFDRIEGSVPDAARPRLLGGFAFFGTEQLGDPWRGFEPAAFYLPSIQIVITDSATWVTAIGQSTGDGESVAATVGSIAEALRADPSPERQEALPGADRRSGVTDPRAPSEQRFRVEKGEWLSRVRSITDTIRSGGLRKAVLAQGLDVPLEGDLDPVEVLETLGERYPDCYRFWFQGQPDGKATHAAAEGGVFFGASPETLVHKSGLDVWTEALAGTVERGDTPAVDAKNEATLRSDPKIEEEHDLVVDHIENRLRTVGDEMTVGDRTVRKLATVQHLQSPLWTTVKPGTHVLDVVEALHPTPAVGGLPPDAARSVIRETESVERGWYAAPVGWFDENGDGTFAVGIRSALATDVRATLFAGNGIVADSDPETEWSEIQLKFGPIRNAIR